MQPLSRASALVAACLLLAAPVAGEIYRWRDSSGREHFAQQLHQVPAEHRAAAQAAAAGARTSGGDASGSHASGSDAARGGLSYHAIPQRRPTAGGRAELREAQAPPAALAPSAGACRAIQKEIARKQAVIRTHQGSVESNQRWADDIDRSPFSRRRYEVRAQEEARWLSRAEQDLERYVDAQRRSGVEPGCLR